MIGKITIIGTGYGWDAAPYDIDNVWAITTLAPTKRTEVNLVIDMNQHADLRWGQVEFDNNLKTIAWCKENSIPYIGLTEYPLKDVLASFGIDFFNSTIDYAIALAITKKPKEIHIYGVNMTHTSEYEYQKFGVDFWCGVAIGRGIKIVVPYKDSAIMKTCDGLMYGYDQKQEQQMPVRSYKRIRTSSSIIHPKEVICKKS